MKRSSIVFVLTIALFQALLAQEESRVPTLSSEDKKVLMQIDSAKSAYESEDWGRTVEIYEQIKGSNFSGHKLLIAAYVSYDKLSILNSNSNLKELSDEVYRKGIEKYGKRLMDSGYAEDVYTIVQKPARPVVGVEEFNDKLLMNVKYPSSALEDKVQGIVFVQFLVNKDGSISGVRPVKGIHPECDKEAIRLIKETSSWEAGEQNGKKINQMMILPVHFNIKKYNKRLKKQGQ